MIALVAGEETFVHKSPAPKRQNGAAKSANGEQGRGRGGAKCETDLGLHETCLALAAETVDPPGPEWAVAPMERWIENDRDTRTKTTLDCSISASTRVPVKTAAAAAAAGGGEARIGKKVVGTWARVDEGTSGSRVFRRYYGCKLREPLGVYLGSIPP